MKGLTNFITEDAWQDTITAWFVLIDDVYQRLCRRGQGVQRRRGPQPIVSDSEIMTQSLIIETWFQGHEEIGYAFIHQYLTALFPRQLDLDRFNVRRRALIAVMERVRKAFRNQVIDAQDTFRLVDSAPITLMTYTRGSRCESVRSPDYFGVVSSKKSRFFWLRLHTTVNCEQVIDDWMLAPACVHDAKALDALVEGRTNLQITGDKAYNDAELEQRLWHKRRILLMPLRRDNMLNQWPEGVQKLLGKIRHRVETVYSTLTSAFNIQRPRGRTLEGHVVRVTTCILAHTLCFVLASIA